MNNDTTKQTQMVWARFICCIPLTTVIALPCRIIWTFGRWFADKLEDYAISIGVYGSQWEKRRNYWIMTGKFMKPCQGCETLRRHDETRQCPYCGYESEP